MYELEIETKNKLKRIKNPRKARFRDRIFFYSIQVMTNDGKWHTICNCSEGVATLRMVVDDINKAIKKRSLSVYLDV